MNQKVCLLFFFSSSPCQLTWNEKDDLPPTHSYQLTPHLIYHPSHVTTLALIKRGQTLDPLTPLASQLHIMNLFGGEETPYEGLHAVVSLGVKPWFDAFVGARSGGKDTGDIRMGECPVNDWIVFRSLCNIRDSNDEEEVCGAGTLSTASPTKCRNSRNPSYHPPSYSKSC